MGLRASRSEMHSEHESDTTTLSRGLGWVGVALGLTGLAIPRKLAQAIDAVAGSRVQHAHDHTNRSASFSVTVNKPPAEVYAFYRRLSQLPLFMNYLALVREADATYSHWVAKLPGGDTIAWDTKITEDRPGKRIAWRSVEGSLITTHGEVTFASVPGRNATEVRVEMQLDFTESKPSKSLARLFTTAQIEGDLARLKQLLETAPLPIAARTIDLVTSYPVC